MNKRIIDQDIPIHDASIDLALDSMFKQFRRMGYLRDKLPPGDVYRAWRFKHQENRFAFVLWWDFSGWDDPFGLQLGQGFERWVGEDADRVDHVVKTVGEIFLNRNHQTREWLEIEHIQILEILADIGCDGMAALSKYIARLISEKYGFVIPLSSRSTVRRLIKLQRHGLAKRITKPPLSDRYPAGYWKITDDGCGFMHEFTGGANHNYLMASHMLWETIE